MKILLSIALSACAAGAAAAEPFYDRIDAKLAKEPALATSLEKPPAELDALRWLVGTWSVTARVFATPKRAEKVETGTSVAAPELDGRWLMVRDHYEGGVDDIGYYGFDPAARRWIAVGLDTAGNAITRSTSSGWRDGRLVFAGPVTILGETVTLRTTLVRRSDDEYQVLNEEKLGGEWRPVDEYVYRRQ